MIRPKPIRMKNGYWIRLADSDDEDLQGVKILGHCLYGYPMDELDKCGTREELADRWYLRLALRPGESTLLISPDGGIAGATRITPSPDGSHDPETGELEYWSTTAIMPEHRGKGLSKSMRDYALRCTDAKVIRSRIKSDNPRSWAVAERLGFKLEDEDDKGERYYRMKLAADATEDVCFLRGPEHFQYGGETPVILLDLDKTLRASPEGQHAPTALGQQIIFERRLPTLYQLKKDGHKIIGVTNFTVWAEDPEGFTLDDVRQINEETMELCQGMLDDIVFPCHSRSKVLKPAPDMLEFVLNNYKVRRDKAVMIGDSEDDEGAAAAAGIGFYNDDDFFGPDTKVDVESASREDVVDEMTDEDALSTVEDAKLAFMRIISKHNAVVDLLAADAFAEAQKLASEGCGDIDSQHNDIQGD